MLKILLRKKYALQAEIITVGTFKNKIKQITSKLFNSL